MKPFRLPVIAAALTIHAHAGDGVFDLTQLTNTRSPSLRDLLAPGGQPHSPSMHDGSFTTVAQGINHYSAIPGNNANLDPNQNLSGSLPQAALAANQLSLTFYAAAAGISYAVESSTDMQNWSTAGSRSQRRTPTNSARQRWMPVIQPGSCGWWRFIESSDRLQSVLRIETTD